MLKFAIIFFTVLTIFIECGPAAVSQSSGQGIPARARLVQHEPVGGRRRADPVFEKRWTLIELGGRRLGTEEPYLEFEMGQGRFSGSSGCNSIFGAYRVDGAEIRFTSIGATRRLCVDSERQKIEAGFLKSLETINRFSVRGSVVRLYAGDDLILTFKVRRRPRTNRAS